MQHIMWMYVNSYIFYIFFLFIGYCLKIFLFYSTYSYIYRKMNFFFFRFTYLKFNFLLLNTDWSRTNYHEHVQIFKNLFILKLKIIESFYIMIHKKCLTVWFTNEWCGNELLPFEHETHLLKKKPHQISNMKMFLSL